MFAVIYLPNFALQAVLRHEPDLRAQPVALLDAKLLKPVVVQWTAAAKSRGVCAGLTASQAMARCAELLIKPRSPAQEEAATEVLLQTAYAFSPNIEATAPGLCTIELKGMPFAAADGEREEWAQKILAVLAQFNLAARAGLAATPELALLAARAEIDSPREATSAKPGERPGEWVVQVQEKNFRWSPISSFPLAALEPPPEILALMQRWGITSIGGLLALGKDNVVERLGPPAVELFDRVAPDCPRPLKLVVPAEEFSEQMEFEHEIETTEPLLFVLRRFVEQLSRRLELIYLVVAELHLQLGLASGARQERRFTIPAPTGNLDVLFRMLQTHLETLRTDSPITSLRLTAKPARPEARQFGLFESTLRDPNQFAETLARLTALCGADRVGTPQLAATHRPDTFQLSPTFAAMDARELSIGRHDTSPEIVADLPPGISALRLRRFRPPRPSQVEFRDERPALLRSECFVGPIVETRGPFFSSGNWWDTGQWARQEWDVETADGSLFRIFRSADGCFVEGVYD